MAFTDNIKEITPAVTELKSNTPVIVIDGKIYVAGIGGNFIPGNAASSQSSINIAAGYITISDSVITFHDITNSTTTEVDKLYITDTGVEEPQYQGGGTPQPISSGVVDVYKVISTSPLTGVKATQYQSDTWQFQSQSVSLIADPNNTPIKDYIYIASGTQLIGAKIKSLSELPIQGLVFYAPLDSMKSAAETGQALTTNGTVTYGTVDGVPCATFDGASYISFPDTDLPTLKNDCTISIWLNRPTTGSGYIPFYYGRHDTGAACGIQDYYGGGSSNQAGWILGTNEAKYFYYDTPVDNWHHICFVCSSGQAYMYFNNILQTTLFYDRGWNSVSTQKSGKAYIGGRVETSSPWYYPGSISALRIYNRALSTAEITALAATPGN